MIKVALRCDASPKIGGGHVMRCLALAEALAGQGFELLFLVRWGTGEAAPALSRFRSGDVSVIGGGAASAAVAIRARWPSGADLIVVDSYAIGADEEGALRSVGRKIMAIDDLADRRHDCDLLLDQNCGRVEQDYAGLVPSGTRLLAGSRYALLRAEFTALREKALARRQESPAAKGILIAMGLTDLGGITLRVVAAALAASAQSRLDVVLGAKAESLAPLAMVAQRDARIRLHVDPENLARLMLAADIGIGALGTMTWERCCLGLPSVGVVLAENQRGIAEEVAKAEAALVIPDAGEIEALLPEMLAQLSADAALRSRLSRNAIALVDGQGSRRVAEAILDTVSH